MGQFQLVLKADQTRVGGVNKGKTINVRLSDSDYTWLTENATEISFFVRSLIQEAKRKDEDRPLKARIGETRKRLAEAEESLATSTRNAWADTDELKGIINRQTKNVERLKAKLAVLTQKT